MLGPDARPESPHRAWPIPARVDDIVLATRRTLFAGDAAAATDPMTGEGIGQALLTGVLAAEAIEAGGLDAARVASTYERRVRDALVADHRMSMLLIRALKHRKGARTAVRIAGATAWTRRNFARWLFEDYPRVDHHDAAPLGARHVHRARRLPLSGAGPTHLGGTEVCRPAGMATPPRVPWAQPGRDHRWRSVGDRADAEHGRRPSFHACCPAVNGRRRCVNAASILTAWSSGA